MYPYLLSVSICLCTICIYLSVSMFICIGIYIYGFLPMCLYFCSYVSVFVNFDVFVSMCYASVLKYPCIYIYVSLCITKEQVNHQVT